MRPLSIPIELWPEAYMPRREPASPQPQPTLELPVPVRHRPARERCEDESRGVVIIDLLGD